MIADPYASEFCMLVSWLTGEFKRRLESSFKLEKQKRIAGHTKQADIEGDVKTIDVPFLRKMLQIPLCGREQWKNNTEFGQRADKHISQFETPISSIEAFVLACI